MQLARLYPGIPGGPELKPSQWCLCNTFGLTVIVKSMNKKENERVQMTSFHI